MNIFEKLRNEGIHYTQTGDYICPKCSEERKKKHLKCFHIEFKSDGVVFRCNHCDYSGGFYNENFIGDIQKKEYTKPKMPNLLDNKEKVYRWLEKRGISKKTTDLFDIGFNNRNEIVMPLFKNGEIVNIKYRGAHKTFRQEKNAESVLYGMKAVETMVSKNHTDTLVWVEGEIDCLSFAEIGIPAVSVPAGASSTRLEYIENCHNWIEGFKHHVIAVDSDEKGEILRDSLVIRLGRERCKLLNFKDYGVKDANDLLVRSKYLLKEAYKNSKFLSIERTISYDDIKHQILELYRNKNNTGISTGWADMNNLIRIKKGKLMIVSGYPTRGKSFFVDNLMLNLTENYGWKHFLFTFENDPKHHFARMCSMRTGNSFFGKENKISENGIIENIDYFNSNFLFSDNTDVWNLDDLIKKAEDMVKHRGVDTILIDPFDRLDIKNGKDLYIYIKNMLSRLSAFARKMNVLVIFIAHPKKPDGENPPTMYHISGSTAWYNAADYGVIIHRDRDEDTHELSTDTRVIISKVKDIDMGNPSGGEALLRFENFRLKSIRKDI